MTMTTLQLNAEIYEALSIIAQDESLLKKAARSQKRLASMKKDETLMSEEEFFATVDQSIQDANQGRIKKVSSEGELVNFLNSLQFMYTLEFTSTAEDTIKKLKRNEPQAFAKLKKLLIELMNHPTTGTGHPEQLKGERVGQWSRRITQKHRLIYQIKEHEVVVLVLSAYGHYDDK